MMIMVIIIQIPYSTVLSILIIIIKVINYGKTSEIFDINTFILFICLCVCLVAFCLPFDVNRF